MYDNVNQFFITDNNFINGAAWVKEPYANVSGHRKWEDEMGGCSQRTTQDTQTQ